MTLDLTQLLIVFGIGLLGVTVIDTLGSITSHIMNYNYVYLSPLSYIIYGLIGYQTHQIPTTQAISSAQVKVAI